MKIEPYLFFDGRCEEAIEFYKRVLGAQVDMMLRYKESPQKPPSGSFPPGTENKIMYANLKIGESRVMAADHCGNGPKPKFDGFSLSASAANETEAKKLFDALADGGHVQMPLGKTFFSPSFGMVVDRFGVMWMVIVPGQTPPA